MAYNGFAPSEEFIKFRNEHGEDTFIKMNLLFIAFELSDLLDDNASVDGFDDLCEDILELSLDEAFEDYSVIEISDAILFIIYDSNYTVAEYEKTYKRNREKIVEELVAALENGSYKE